MSTQERPTLADTIFNLDQQIFGPEKASREAADYMATWLLTMSGREPEPSDDEVTAFVTEIQDMRARGGQNA